MITHIIGWTNFRNPNFRLCCSNKEDTKQDYWIAECIVINYIRNNNIKMSGYTLQGYPYTDGRHGYAPVFNDGTIFHCTLKEWGKIMSLAYPDIYGRFDYDPRQYIAWAYNPPKDEQEILPYRTL